MEHVIFFSKKLRNEKKGKKGREKEKGQQVEKDRMEGLCYLKLEPELGSGPFFCWVFRYL